ncbi:MAG TPA: type II secretion system protein GspK [Kiritimatiellia bacterium]|jgi:type II secretory pathway component PulK|nr:general secretion pathway protein GspK [Kiritimatiellia bacterium]OQC60522.1 MAG: General secretion pathway protein K [Verrucomicrobia bacterium ADurb.Bin018]MBP9572299.1 general secretion pathway protein GspK [Kiritimatiellia bacterium]HOD99558.1 type II secretion system protein GspK [Kiritimatiellia bacterium]HOE35950.1 type II secretion system protein GspK [Kiritimatiellia bacterium]
MPRHPAARTGMALILVLAAIVLAGGLALYLQARAAAAARLEQAELTRERLRLAAGEAAREALWLLAADDDRQVDHLGEDWAKPHENQRDDGVYTWSLIEDAGRFFNLNNLAVATQGPRPANEILLDLLTFCGDFSPSVRVAALTDFVDGDEDGPYEAEFYRRPTDPYRPPNRELWAPAEVLRVHDFTAELFRPRPRGPADDLFGGDFSSAAVIVPQRLNKPVPINVNTASRDVLMGLTSLQHDAVVRKVMAIRQTQPFESLAMIFAAYPEFAAALADSVSTASTIFRVRARAAADSQRWSVMAWVERSPDTGAIRILQWVEAGG